MINREVISPNTNSALLETVGRYFETIVPYDQGDDVGFMAAYLGRVPEAASMMIVGDPDTLTINMYGDAGETRRLLTIDLCRPDVDGASIVAPGLYAMSGLRDSEHGRMMRPVVRMLRENEGQELTMDLCSIMAKAPANRRKAKAHQ